MGTSCCGKPIATIIKVADLEAGIIGLENVFRSVHMSGVHDEEELMNDLLTLVKDSGNYISASRERDYKKALLREYRAYVANLEHNASRR